MVVVTLWGTNLTHFEHEVNQNETFSLPHLLHSTAGCLDGLPSLPSLQFQEIVTRLKLDSNPTKSTESVMNSNETDPKFQKIGYKLG